MGQIAITVKPIGKGRKVIVELDANRLERLASNLGFYSSDFIKSVERAEKDYRAGRVKKVSSLRHLRR